MQAILDAVTHDEDRDVYVVDVPRAWAIIRGAPVNETLALILHTNQHPAEVQAELVSGKREPRKADGSSGVLAGMITQAVHDALGRTSISVQLVGAKFA